MKKIIAVVFALVMSSPVFAGDFSIFSPAETHWDKIHKCICDAWKDAEPTDDQNEAAKPFMEAARKTWNLHKDAIEGAKQELTAAWHAHPISESDVKGAEDHLLFDMIPVHIAMRHAAISVINLLTDDQRSDFDDSLKDCLHGDELFRLN
jgi:hypothetical protein